MATAAIAPHRLGGIEVHNTNDIVNEFTKWCGLVYAPAKFGKTTLAESMNRMTQRFFGKPTLIVACESADGGGTMSLRGMGVDYVVPRTLDECRKIVAELYVDKYYGGVVLDSATEYVKAFLQPYALKFPSREKVATREAGVPEMSDYQTMGEVCRQDLQRLVLLSSHANHDIRKHVMVTALEKEKYDRKTQELLSIQPDLPGAMATTATAMFQSVMQIAIRTSVEKQANGQSVRTKRRVLITEGDGVRVIGDRTKLLPSECEPDLEIIWEKYWLPVINGRKEVVQDEIPKGVSV
jgi:hypothetical protein